ncbi:GPI mannosyltransferase 2 [Collybia nuda]|uniref:GPI mannosyltransferase 2 n=1 Tax=Collybia nuda TaxID=64659 RepID=A0A9P5YE83_9AGAR|nr:GPI mannosyltransferase 2 [Collybia nuda]
MILLVVLSRVSTFVLLVVCARRVPLFDAAPRLVLASPWSQPLLRWDSFHFLHIARYGYSYENQWAFFPGVPFLIRTASALLSVFHAHAHPDLLLSAAFLAAACDGTYTLYQLSLHHLRNPHLALLAALLSLIPSSPATLHFTPYTEPFFTFLSYKGMLYCARRSWARAAVAFALAGAFRSNGVLLGGFILWGLVLQPFLDTKRISVLNTIYALFLTALVFLPFAAHNYAAYRAFCTSTPAPVWCTASPLPLIYTHVQATYWNVGFFRYWTTAQIPNFIIAAPPLALLTTWASWHLSTSTWPRLRNTTSLLARAEDAPFLAPALTPHAIHALVLVASLLFASHTQIALRQAASIPATYWAAAWLVYKYPACGRLWVGWSLTWGWLSVVLWAAGLPPA